MNVDMALLDSLSFLFTGLWGEMQMKTLLAKIRIFRLCFLFRLRSPEV